MKAMNFAAAALIAASLALPAAAQTASAPATAVAPTTAAPAAPAAKAATPKVTKSTTVVVNINTSTSAELQQVKGIGKSHATAIIKARPFTTLDDLVTKKILTKAELAKLKPQLSL